MNEREKQLEIISRYLDGVASDDEVAKLDRLLGDDENFADLFARMCQIEISLKERLCKPTATDFSFSNETSQVDPQHGVNWISRHRIRVAVSTAALVLLSTSLLILLLLGDAPSNSNEVAHNVVSGHVAFNGEPVDQVGFGQEVEVVSNEPATIELSDGSLAEFTPGTKVRIHGEEEELRQRVELLTGQGTFDVTQDPGAFRVDTEFGQVLVLGTVFTVALQPRSAKLPDDPRALFDETTNSKPDQQMQVSVKKGRVRVDAQEASVFLNSGESRVFQVKTDRSLSAPRKNQR